MERPVFVEAERLAAFKQRGAEVDVVLDLMIHDLDLACALARAEPSAVSACGFRVLTSDIDIANARIEFENGCVANLSASRVSQTAVRKLRVFQPGLYVSADLQAGKLRYVRQSAGEIEQTDESHPGGDALAEQAAAFAAAVHGRRRVQLDGREGRRALELALTVGRLVRERLEKFE
jgi:predicted dehydrogenase